jgi:hypothetical protein
MECGLRAGRRPKGMQSINENTIEAIANSTVAGHLSKINSDTGKPLTSDLPRSP